jgi:lipoprotein-releasing system ATP-binding protein
VAVTRTGKPVKTASRSRTAPGAAGRRKPARQTAVEVRELVKSYATEAEVLTVLSRLSFSLDAGEALSVIGESGTGKSTLLNMIGGLDYVSSGSVRVYDTSIETLSENELAEFRNRNIGFVFQYHHLLPDFTALENAIIPALVCGIPRHEAEERGRALLDEAGLSGRIDHKPSQLSGGEQQRVALVRALINEPGLILLDEPTGNLDERTGHTVMQMIWRIQERHNLAVVLVTHNLAIARETHRCLRLAGGHGEIVRI